LSAAIAPCSAGRGRGLESGGRQQPSASQRENRAERDHLALGDELAEEECLRAERQREEDVAVERVSDGRAQADAEREPPFPKRREDDRLNRLTDGEGDDACDRDLLELVQPAASPIAHDARPAL